MKLTIRKNHLLIYFILIWVYIWENFRILKYQDLSTHVFFYLPESAKYLDVFLINTFFIVIMLGLLSNPEIIKNDRFFKVSLLLVSFIFIVSFVSWLINGLFNYDLYDTVYIQFISKYLRPLQVYIITYYLFSEFDNKLLINTIKIILCFSLISLFNALYQISTGAIIDDVYGIVRDAHMLVLQLIFLAVIVTFLSINYKKYYLLTFSFFALITIMYASYTKAIFAFIITIPLYFIFSKRKFNLKIILYSFIVTSGIYIIYVNIKIANNSSPFMYYFNTGFDYLLQIPYIKAYYMIPTILQEYPKLWLIGFGPGNLTGGMDLYTDNYYEFIEMIGISGLVTNLSMNVPTNSALVLIYDFGILIFILF